MTIALDAFASRMAREELNELRLRVDCRAVLEEAGWTLDAAGSTRRTPKYRNGPGRIVIVIHEGKGWFDPLAGKRGDAIALAQHVWGGNLGHARRALRPLAGIAPKLVPVRHSCPEVSLDAEQGWARARVLRPGSACWRYLVETRGLPVVSVERAVREHAVQEGGYGTAWAVHRGIEGRATGWEMRGAGYKGFSRGGTKTLFLIGDQNSPIRLAVTESAIDAMSLGTIEGWPERTLYASTAGGFGSATATALQSLLQNGTVELVAATDRGTGGELLAGRLRELASATSAPFSRLCPIAKDWNDQLRQGQGTAAMDEHAADLHVAEAIQTFFPLLPTSLSRSRVSHQLCWTRAGYVGW